MLPMLLNLPRARTLMERAGIAAVEAQLPRRETGLTGGPVVLGQLEYRPVFINENKKIKTSSELDLMTEDARLNSHGCEPLTRVSLDILVA